MGSMLKEKTGGSQGRSKSLLDHFTEYFSVEFATTPEQLHEIYHIRFRVYCEEFKYEPIPEDLHDRDQGEERDEFEDRVRSDYRHYQSELDRMQRDIDSMELRVIKKLFAEIDAAIAQVGADGDYHLVLDGTPKDTPGSVVYYSPTLNMTQKVVDYINSHDMAKSE